ncbi:MAG: FadR/GntR family transcriptional regulator, partial [Bacillota bacterium]
MEIQPLRRRNTLSTDIARQLHDMIQSGSLRPGDRLPGQRDLAVRFGASMASVREAISALAAAGLVDAHPGKGTVVRGFAEAEPQFDGWLGTAGALEEMNELLEARRLLEAHLAAQAARRRTPAQVERLRRLLADMEAALTDPDAYLEADLAFHLALAEVAGNRVLARMIRAIQAPMKHQLHHSNLQHMVRQGSLWVSYETHLRLVDAIEAGNAAA